jgi:hypothetical protein
MPRLTGWTASQTVAFEYATSWAAGQMTQSDALGAYRAGGGHIGNALWAECYQAGLEAADISKRVAGQTGDVPLPWQAYTETPRDYSKNFNATGTITYWDRETESYLTRYATIQSDQAMTVADTEEALSKVAVKSGSDPSAVEGDVSDVFYWKRSVFLPSLAEVEWLQ